MAYEMVIGLEVHAQLKTQTKLFCGCSTQFGSDINSNVCPVCLGLPGALPVLNKRAVEMAMMAGKALNCDVQPLSVFDRKNYFYPDLPKGYQISQFPLPICLDGHLDIDVDGEAKRIGITRIHMEEDAGKLLHQGAEGIADSTHSLVDLNRACTPLIEIVSEPDIRSAAEARAYVEQLRQILRTIGVNDGNLEEGSLRVDVNLSLRPEGTEAFGTRTEVKNVNSFRSIERAIKSEFRRQKALLESGDEVVQQTRNYHDDTQSTTVLRDKEDAHDYRYFPEPDLLPLRISEEWMSEVMAAMPPLPEDLRRRYEDELSVSSFDFHVLLEETDMRAFLESCLVDADPQLAPELSKWIVGDVNAALKDKGGFAETSLSPAHVLEMVTMIQSSKISGKMAKDLLPKMLDSGEAPSALLEKAGGGQISDTSELQSMIETVLSDNPDVVEKIKNGKTSSVNFLIGQVMKASRGKANPDLLRQMMSDTLGL